MKYIEELREGERITEIYLCRSRKSALTKAGKTFESVTLQDKTGTLDSKIWDPDSPGIEEFDALDYIEVTGDISNYQGKLQLSIKRVRKAYADEYDPKEYLPVSPYNPDDMYTKLLEFVDSVENTYLHALLDSFFREDAFREAFCFHSAAKVVHHGFVGGLLQHTLFVTRICSFMSKQYPILNHDLLLTAAMCHDIGKVAELSRFPENDYTDDGQLLGHIIIGTEMVNDRIREIDGFPPQLASELKHCLLAHHGELEYGSPKKPALIEAMALSMADNMDAKMETFAEVLHKAGADNYEWQGFNRLLDSNVRRTHGDT